MIQSAVHSPQSTVHSLQSAVHSPQSTVPCFVACYEQPPLGAFAMSPTV